MAYATIRDVEAQCKTILQGENLLKFTQDSIPSDADVMNWLRHAETKVNGVLAAGSVSTPITNVSGIEILSGVVTAYAVGQVIRQHKLANNQDLTEEDGEPLEQFKAVLEDMRKDPEFWDKYLNGLTGATGTEQTKVMTHVDTNSYGLSKGAGDFESKFRDFKF